MSDKISVIIPVYNVEEYLKNCIDSIMNQTYQDFELILVDDGSTDKSGQICDSFKNSGIKVVHKQNAGPSAARNAGMLLAEGEYIVWIDSDDIIHPRMFETLISLIKKYDADIATVELKAIRSKEQIKVTNGYYETGCYRGSEALLRMIRGELHGTSACGLIMHKNLACKFEFPIGKFHEDDLTTYKFFKTSEKVAYTKQPMYYYLQRAESIMHKSRVSIIDIEELDAADVLYNTFKKWGNEYENAALVKKTTNYLDIAQKYSDLNKISPEIYNRINRFFESEIGRILKNKYIEKKKKIKIVLYRLGLLNKVIKLIR